MEPIRAIMAFDASIDPERFASDCSAWGLDTAVLHPGFLEDERMPRALEREGLALWLNLPVFYDPAYLEEHPESYALTSRGRPAAVDWVRFVCPSREEHLERLVRDLRGLLSRLQPAVVSLDFIRHFVFWELVDLDGPASEIEDGCYCPFCLTGFERDCGERVDREDAVSQIRGPLRERWGDWKCRSIAAVAERLLDEIRRLCPQAALSLKSVPWREADLDGALRWSAGQDVTRLLHGVDLAAPMAYAQMLARTPEWKAELLADVRERTGKPVVSYVQVEGAYRPEPISLRRFEQELDASLGDQVAGIAVYRYEQLTVSPDKVEALSKRLRGA